ncbi:hypothetical protein SAMN05421770_11112 [Granulicella rosea]|uniref:Uncharacterized protein n=1 Tax=Granulicella rosea TaxID=474952 RepID=A0A239MA59_9BACT|nr:hypothetical protein [Granulicella rosea]SNT39370.1 hypothetical protein SAMN05421770_11112 [Granulicella rosea]
MKMRHHNPIGCPMITKAKPKLSWGVSLRCTAIAATLAFANVMIAPAQTLGPPPIPPKNAKKQKIQWVDTEWLWQYSPPPAEGRENDLIQDPHFRPFIDQYLTAPQAFWGPNMPPRKSLADTAYDFLAIPGKVIADDNRYLTFTGCVFHFCPSRGLVFVDLNSGQKNTQPLVVFAAIDWIRESKVTTDPGAEYTLWIFPDVAMTSDHLPAPLVKSLVRWSEEPIARTGIHQRITTAVLVDPDGTPHPFKPDTIGILDPQTTKPEATK